MARFIFVTGGVVSSLGKGISAASVAVLLQAHGYKVRLRKLDPYLNVDPGTMSPYQHGEVFVTEDGTESDLDLGHYERFTNIPAKATDSTSTGKVYANILQKERRGDYLGATVQVIPHVTDEIKAFIMNESAEEDFIIAEIGGTVGDIEGLPYLEAIRQLSNDVGRENALFIHLTLIPYLASAGELKTKPTQHSVKELLSVGIQPDILLCRCDRSISLEARRKIALFCNLKPQNVIAVQDADTIYQIPLSLRDDRLDQLICDHFQLTQKNPDLEHWSETAERVRKPEHTIPIAIVGKYVRLHDAYRSLVEALNHGGIASKARIQVEWIDSEQPEEAILSALKTIQGVVVPGGFGERGVEGKLHAIQYVREHKIPFLGICFGMQLAVIETCRNLLRLEKASSTEFGPTSEPVIGLLTEWLSKEQIERREADGDLGGTMRLGSYPCCLEEGSLAQRVYQCDHIRERHRHRFEVNKTYQDRLATVGMQISGMSPDQELVEIVERPDHPWFIGVQFHPEFQSRPFALHPLFVSFIQAALKREKLL